MSNTATVRGYPHQTIRETEEECPQCKGKMVEVTASRYMFMKEGFYLVFLRCNDCGKMIQLPS